MLSFFLFVNCVSFFFHNYTENKRGHSFHKYSEKESNYFAKDRNPHLSVCVFPACPVISGFLSMDSIYPRNTCKRLNTE